MVHRASASLSLSAALLLAWAAPARAQPTFKGGVEMVAVTVTVTDTTGRSVTGLTAGDFAIHEDGVPQSVSLFGSDEVPVDVALVVDTSASMTVDLPVVKQAAIGLVGQLRRGDRAAVVDVKTVVAIPQPFTDDHQEAVDTIKALRATGSTAMFDGIYTSLREFERHRRLAPETRRQALVLLSDGFDTASHVALEDVAELARRLDVMIYTIALRQGAAASTNQGSYRDDLQQANFALRSLARETGGLAFFPAGSRMLDAIYNAIGRELVSQYLLGYVPGPSRTDTSVKRIGVRVLPPASGTARTRSGYVARGTASGAASTGQEPIESTVKPQDHPAVSR